MKHIIRLTLSLFGFALLATVATPQVTYAALPVPDGGARNVCTNDAGVEISTPAEGDCAKETAFTFGSCGNKLVGISCLVTELMKFLAVLVGIAVVAGITVGGIVYSSGAGNSSRTQKGISIIVNSLIGLLLYLLMFGIVNFLVPGGILQ